MKTIACEMKPVADISFLIIHSRININTLIIN
jgi:hypothetical protein